MNRGTMVTAVVLGLTLVAVTVALLMEANRGPSFRPRDYETLQECLANIPVEWAPGSLQRDGAVEACQYVHGRR
ncbi:MAG: hypothetical protein ACN0LA_09140 [Candidatus Longimicrobiales bacterium M2_2A_002]